MISRTLQRSTSIRWCAVWASSLIAKKMNFLTYLFSSLNPKPRVWTPSPLTVLNSLVKLSLYRVLCNDGRDSINLLHNGPAPFFFFFLSPPPPNPFPLPCTGRIQNADISLLLKRSLSSCSTSDVTQFARRRCWTDQHRAGCQGET